MQVNTSYRTKNFDHRPQSIKIDYIIIHYTDRNFDTSLNLLTNTSSSPVSCHFLIDQKGKIFQLLGVRLRAWHAGVSYWRGQENLNNNSIGIEIVNFDQNPYTSQQIQACIKLCKYLMKIYIIARENVLAHSDIAPYRKKDPGSHFPWNQLIKSSIVPSLDKFSPNYNKRNAIDYLGQIGYDIRPLKINSILQNLLLVSFQSRFCQHNVTGQLNDTTHDMINRANQAYSH